MPPCKEEDANALAVDEWSDISSTDEPHWAATDSTTTKESNKSSSVEDSSKLWWIHGNGYDLQEFVDRHPGGKEAILLGKGRDCTALVESYHAFSPGYNKVLEKFLVEEKSKSPEPDFFYEILKERVTGALRAKGLDPQKDRGANWGRFLYYGLVVLSFLVTGYLHAVKGSILGSFLFAWAGWFMGAIGHDSGHFATSHDHPLLNEWGVWAMSFIANPIMWQHQHTYAHHSFTNEHSHDPDLHHFNEFIRVHIKSKYVSEKQRHLWYVMLCYTLPVFASCLKYPMDMINEGMLCMVRWQDKDRFSKQLGMRFHVMLYSAVVVVAPFFSHSSVIMALASVLLHMVTLGWLYALFSQINHINEDSLSSDLETKAKGQGSNKLDPRLAGSWAAAQVETANNFAPDSLVWHILSNGLNMQIEHHLFPGLNHCHLHLIAPVVRKTCEEYGVQYKCFGSWREVMSIHLTWYKKLSYPPSPLETKE
ncbi:Probable Delta(5) fatty acid desaturase C [Seminavis robusta]|uniref:Probable Delta(5) fatty acid desaturase C n=1 Tax=Seminavis robusta TaxID=568900 RepID=A0A9N8H594_9STRA|nr:Probable Delta(5) fatty acid desaturase C [Seminavis robusta]|eukprot:Sro20_g013920.1 Probable Delta(5) fatty acid desaturase C (479) ;mRNA; f:36320-37861